MKSEKLGLIINSLKIIEVFIYKIPPSLPLPKRGKGRLFNYETLKNGELFSE
jgi:hypothetical protein